MLAQGKIRKAQSVFDQVYTELLGETVPKLALALASERAGHMALAIHLFDRVSRTDPGFPSAAFGLVQCLSATGDRHGAVAALQRLPQTSTLYTRAQVEITRLLISDTGTPPGAEELRRAAATLEALPFHGLERHQLALQVLETALRLLTACTLPPTASVQVLGYPLEERALRLGLEHTLRTLAHLSVGADKIRLVDDANRVRPHTLW